MNKLIAEFRKEHIRIIDTLSKVVELGITSKEGQKLLLSARMELLNHLQKEDIILYPELEKAAGRNRRLKQTLFMFSHNIGDLTKRVTRFFDQYASGVEGPEFRTDFGNFVTLLVDRLREEENVLFPEFERIHQQLEV